MNRPVMDITYLEEPNVSAAFRAKAKGVFLMGKLTTMARLLLRTISRIVRMCIRVLLYDPLANTALGVRFRNDDGSRATRVVRGLAYRLAFLPVLAALCACAFVYSGTHPRAVVSERDPATIGLYYDAISLVTDDNIHLDAWFVPALEAKDVIDQREKMLREKCPAVVLLHDFGSRRAEMLPLISALHDAGYVVLVPALRGCGTSQAVGQTFGLHEALDVKAAVDLLRKRNFVDPNRIALIGIGTGANAAVLAANQDNKLHTIVLADPTSGIDEIVKQHILPPYQCFNWARPLCKWTFEIAYSVDGEELNMSQYSDLLKDRRALVINQTAMSPNVGSKRSVEQIKTFLATAQ